MYHILLYPEASKGKQDFFFICAKTDFLLKVGSIKNRYFCTPRYWFVPPRQSAQQTCRNEKIRFLRREVSDTYAKKNCFLVLACYVSDSFLLAKSGDFASYTYPSPTGCATEL